MRRICLQESLLACLLIVGLAVSALAQPGNGGRDVVRNELDRTREMVDRTAEVIRSAGCPLGAVQLEAAIKQQDRAEDAFRNNQMVLAHTQTQKARELLRTALSNCRTSEQGEAVVQRSLEKAQDLLDRAGNALLDSSNPNLQAIYQAAKDNLTRAWEFYRQKQYKPAAKLAEQVEKMALKILGADNRQERRTETYDRRRENVLHVLEQARTTVGECGSETARNLLTRAEDLFAKAEQLRQDGQVAAALTALAQARTLATRSITECENGDGLQLRYQRLLSRLESLRERSSGLGEPGHGQVTRLLDQATHQLTLAQECLAKGETDKGLAALQGAQLVLRQAEAILP